MRWEPGNAPGINWPDLVPRTPRIGDRSKPRLGHSAGFCWHQRKAPPKRGTCGFDADPNPCLDSYVTVISRPTNPYQRLEAGNTVRSLGTSSTHQRCWRAMNATLTKQFEGFAECCLELARSAETTERRARFIQMAHEYRLATLLTSEELSSGPKGRRLLPAAE